MNNQDKLNMIFFSVFCVPSDSVIEELSYDSITNWDSISHMTLVSELEEKFDISFDFDQITEMTSYIKVRELLVSQGVIL